MSHICPPMSYICPPSQIYARRCHIYARRCHIYARPCHIYARPCHIYALEGGPFFFLKKLQKSDIFIIYMGSSRAKYNDIAASTSAFFSSVKKLPRELSVPSGLRPSGTDSSPRQFFTSKKNASLSGLYRRI